MSAIENQPANKNFLSPLGFKFNIKRTPNVNWFVQSVVLPSIDLPPTTVNNPFIKFPVGGDHIDVGTLQVSFRVDENMENYLELYNWLIAIGFPDNFEQYKPVAKQRRDPLSGFSTPASGTGVFSDATLIILTSAMRPNIEITFIDLYPLSLSPLAFNTQLNDVSYIEAQATFGCTRFLIDGV